MTITTQLGTLAALKTLKNLDNLSIDLTPVINQLALLETKINQIPTTDSEVLNQMSDLSVAIDNQTLELGQKLTVIATNLANLNSNSQAGLILTPLTLQPTFENNASNGWYTAPTNTNLIFDGDENTSTNTFRANSAQYSECYLKINAGISIPTCTRIQIKMGVSNLSNNKSYFEWSAGSGSGDKNVFWSDFTVRSSTETIVVFERDIPFSWEWLKLTLVEMVSWPPLAKIYSIKVWKVE